MGVGPTPQGSTWFRYRAADHEVMSEERTLASVLSVSRGGPALQARAALGWQHTRSLTAVGLRGDEGVAAEADPLVWGPSTVPGVDPFHAYSGDDPFWQSAGSDRLQARVDLSRPFGPHQRLLFGAGATYDEVWLEEKDNAAPSIAGVDTLRRYRGFAPGGFAYVQHRWDYQGLTWNAGLRLQAFTAGPQATSRGPTYWSPAVGHGPANWSWSPRIGFAYPMSDRDVFSLAYTRIDQDPPRDFLYDNRRINYNRSPLGNPALEPGEVISYQAAVKHVLDPLWSLQLGVFARDFYGQVGTRLEQTWPGVYRLHYTNEDEGHASGFELSLVRELPRRSRIEIAYTYMNAAGTQSSEAGLAFGPVISERPVPIGEHPLDWDQRHALTVSAQLRGPRSLNVSWSTRVASGRPWTPVLRDTLDSSWPPQYADQSQVNSRQLPVQEVTNVTLSWAPRWLRGASALLEVTNLFDNRAAVTATLGGYPNPVINTLYDEYAAYRTETGLDGGGFWGTDASGRHVWLPVHDPRLNAPARTLRIGIEIGH